MINFFGWFGDKRRDVDRKIDAFLKNLSINRVDSFREFPDIDIEKPFNAYVTLAILLREKGEFHKGIKLLENLLGQNLSSDDEKLVILNLAITYKAAGFMDRAEALLKDGMKKYPAESFFYYELAKVNQMYDNWEEAVKNLEISQGLNGGFKEDLFYTKLFFINRLIDNSSLDKAFVVMKTLNDIFLVPFFYYTLARIYFSVGDDDRAIKNVEIGMRLSEKQSDIFLNLYEEYKGASFEWIEIMIKRVGLLYSLGLRYARLLEEKGENEKALSVISQLADRFPLKAEVKEIHLKLLWKLGRRKEAVDVILSSLERLKKERKLYVCESCGYKTDTFEWCCPKCKTWESLSIDIG